MPQKVLDHKRKQKLTYDPVHQYYDMQIYNNNPEEKLPVILNFSDTRNIPYLSNADDYYFSIIRFSLDTPSLPVFIPQVELNQPNPNLLIYGITLETVGNTTGNTYISQVPVLFSPQVLNQPVPSAVGSSQDLTTEYYYLYNYKFFINMINSAFGSAVSNLNGSLTAGGDGTISTSPPYFEYDPDSGKVILNAPQSDYDLSNPPNEVRIYFNKALYTIFHSLPAFKVNANQGRDWLLDIYTEPESGNVFNPPAPAPAYLQIYQSWESMADMTTPISSIVFVASDIPITPEDVAQPQVFGSSTSSLKNTGNNSNILAIATDFITESNYFSNITYEPSVYRLIDLNGDSTLSSVSIQVFWKDRFGNLRPFFLDNQAQASLKIMFRKKRYPLLDEDKAIHEKLLSGK